MQYINIHTHDKKSVTGAIHNLSTDFRQNQQDAFYSAGLHPWYLLGKTVEQNFQELKSICLQKNVVAIGECGLDKVCKTNFNLQESYFIKQIQLANEINKPLIIHCVRAYDEVLQVLKTSNNHVAVIFHGFNKNLLTAKKILDQGYYLSFGKQLTNTTSTNIDVFKQVPLDKLFFETDDADIEIESVYKSAATIKQIDVAILAEQIIKNTKLIFGKKLYRI